jgi:hypothetical protein
MPARTRRSRPNFRRSLALCGLAFAPSWSCSSAGPTQDPTGEPALARPAQAAAGGAEAPTKRPPTLALAKVSQREHPAKVAWIFDEDPKKPRKAEIAAAEGEGYTIVDLSDGWVPYIFSEKTVGADDLAANDYRARYIGLASDRIDAEGEPLRAHERNYLELYGIPPTLSVIHGEWKSVDAEIQRCLDAAGFDPAVFARFSGVIAYEAGKKGAAKVRKAKWLRSDLSKKLKKAKLDPDDLATAEADPRFSGQYKSWRLLQDEIDIIDHAQRRFRCEQLFASGEGKSASTSPASSTRHHPRPRRLRKEARDHGLGPLHPRQRRRPRHDHGADHPRPPPAGPRGARRRRRQRPRGRQRRPLEEGLRVEGQVRREPAAARHGERGPGARDRGPRPRHPRVSAPPARPPLRSPTQRLRRAARRRPHA